MKILLVVVFSYLIGSFSSSYFLGKTKNIDIREHGSGNAGSTNTLRVLGKKYAAITFFLDVLKGVIAVILGRRLLGENGSLLASFFVVMGHNYPFYLNFKGGKGVATSIGVICSLDIRVGLACIIIGILTVAISKYVSLGSILGAISTPITMNIIGRPSLNFNLTVMVLVAFILIRHRENIVRLKNGVENKLKL